MGTMLTQALATFVLLLGGAAFFLWLQLGVTKDQLERVENIVKVQELVIEAQNRITIRENQLDRVVERALRRIQESPNAQVLVPPDIADAWGDGIDSVRNDAGISDRGSEKLPGPDRAPPSDRGPDDRPAGDVLRPTGNRPR